MYFQYFMIGLLAVCGVLLLVNVLKGLIRGLKKTVGTLVAIVLSAVAAAIVTLFVCKPESALIAFVMEKLPELFPDGGINDILAIEELGTALGYYSSWLIAPFFFVVAFILLSIVISIIVAILVKVIPPYKKPGMVAHRLGGMGVGVLCALLVAMITLSPIGIVLNIVNDSGLDGKIAEGDEEIALFLEDCENDTVVSILRGVARPIEGVLCSSKLEGEKVSLSDEIAVVSSVVNNVETLGVPMAEYGDAQIEAIDSILVGVESAGVLRSAFAGVLSTVSEKWLAGEPFLGMEKFSAGDLIDPMIDKMLEVFATSTKDTVSADLGTMRDVFAVLIENDLLNSANESEDMLTKLGESGAISELLVAVNSNPRMAPLADEIASLSIKALATAIGIPADADEAYDELMGSIADTLTSSYGMSEEEREILVEREVSTALDRYGIEVSGEAASNVVSSILKDLGDKQSVNASEVSEFFLIYTIASEDKSAGVNGAGYSFDLLSSEEKHSVEFRGETLVIDGRVLTGYTVSDYRDSAAYRDGVNGVDFGTAATLFSAEAMDSVLLTVADIMESLGTFTNCEDIEAEAQKIGAIIVKAADVFSGIDFDNTDASEILEKMGGLLDEMKATKIFGAQSTANLIKAIVQNKTVTESLGISNAQATSFADKLGEVGSKSETGYADATNAVSVTITAIDVSKDATKTAEEKKQASANMIEAMTTDNAELLGTLMSGDMMTKQGAASESAEQVSEVMNLLLDNMAAYKSGNPDKDSIASEADAVNHTLSLAAMGTDSLKEQTLFDTADGEKGVLGSTPDAFIDTVVNSAVIMTTVEQAVYDKEMGKNPLGIPELTESEVARVEDALENYFTDNGGGAELARKLEAIAAMVNVDVNLQ